MCKMQNVITFSFLRLSGGICRRSTCTIVIAFCCHCLHSEGEWAGHRVWDKTTPNVTDATKHYPDIEAGWADTPVDRPPLPRRAQLNEAAKFKHIGPTCKSKEDAERKSVERNSKYPQDVGEINTVFQVTLKRVDLDLNPVFVLLLSWFRSTLITSSSLKTRYMAKCWNPGRQWDIGTARRYQTLNTR